MTLRVLRDNGALAPVVQPVLLNSVEKSPPSARQASENVPASSVASQWLRAPLFALPLPPVERVFVTDDRPVLDLALRGPIRPTPRVFPWRGGLGSERLSPATEGHSGMDHTKYRGRWTAPRGRGLFLLDAAGALLSALMLGVVLVRLEAVFGIPLSALQVLAALPLLFVAYDLVCYRWAGARVGLGLKGIACMNLVYCGVSLSLCLLHRASVTALGWVYILGEVTIVVALAAYEWRAASGAAGGE